MKRPMMARATVLLPPLGVSRRSSTKLWVFCRLVRALSNCAIRRLSPRLLLIFR